MVPRRPAAARSCGVNPETRARGRAAAYRRGMDWTSFEAEGEAAFRGRGRSPLRAYSEFMPAQYVGWKPCARGTGRAAATLGHREIDEYEWAHEIAPGLDRIAERILHELGKLVRGEPHALSHTL